MRKTPDNRECEAHTHGMGLLRLSALLAIVMLVGAACSSSNSPTGPGSPGSPGTTSTLTATIDGVAFVGTNVTATFNAGTNFSTLLVNALDAGKNLLSFDIGTPLRTAFTADTYLLGSNGSNATYNPFGATGSTGWTALTGPQSGSVIVMGFSTTTKTASGTFSFLLHNNASAKTVTNGIFSVTFP
jgi:hypothetical protein